MQFEKRPLLFVSENFPPVVGGSSTVYDELCRRNSDLVVALCPTTSRLGSDIFPTKEYDKTCGYPVARRPLLRGSSLSSSKKLGVIKRLGEILRDTRIGLSTMIDVWLLSRKYGVEVVCVGELIYGGWIALFAQYVLGKKGVIYCHGEEITQESGGLLARLRGFTLRHVDAVLAVSLFCKSEIVSRYGVVPSKIVLIGNGVDVDRFYPDYHSNRLKASKGLEEKTVLVSVGRHVPRKGFDQLIKAFSQVVDAQPNSHLILVGEGPQTPKLKHMVCATGLERNVTFPGLVSDEDLRAYYQMATAFIMPNRTMPDGDTEGFGLVFLEANACGTPVVGGRAGGAIEAVVDGETGYLVNGNSDDEIAHAITKIIGDVALHHAMAKNAIAHSKRNTWEQKAKLFRHTIQCLEQGSSLQPTEQLRASESLAPTEEKPPGKIKFLLTVDFEESFDWSAIFSTQHAIRTLDGVGALQSFCGSMGISPIYFATHGVLTSNEAVEFLSSLLTRDECEIGIHLHSWSTPPHGESLNEFNTFQCNLPIHLQAAKISSLCSAFRRAFGYSPILHRAGRYGVGPSTYDILERAGIKVDFSPNAGFNFEKLGGPNFSTLSHKPFWAGSGGSVLSIPVPSARMIWGPDEFTRVWQIISRRRYGNPVRLSVEGNPLSRMKFVTDRILDDGNQLLVVSLHSTSLEVGGNPYSKSSADVERNLEIMKEYLEWLIRHYDAEPTSAGSALMMYRDSMPAEYRQR